MEVYTFSSPRPQNLCLPYSMMKYIPQAWSPDVYQKLTLTSKHFFATHRILVVSSIKIGKDRRPLAKTWLRQNNRNIKKEKYLNLKSTKLWIRDACQLINQRESILSICKTIYSNNPTAIYFFLRDCNIMYEELKVLAEHFIKLSMDRCVIEDIDKDPVSLGDIMAAIPNIVHFTYEPTRRQDINFRQTSTNAIPYLPNLTQFSFRCESFWPGDFCEFVRLHPGRKFKYYTSLRVSQTEPIFSALSFKFPEGVATHPLEQYRGLWVFKFGTTVVEILYQGF